MPAKKPDPKSTGGKKTPPKNKTPPKKSTPPKDGAKPAPKVGAPGGPSGAARKSDPAGAKPAGAKPAAKTGPRGSKGGATADAADDAKPFTPGPPTEMPTEVVPKAQACEILKALVKEDYSACAAIDESNVPEPVRQVGINAAAVFKDMLTKDSWGGFQYWVKASGDHIDDFHEEVDQDVKKMKKEVKDLLVKYGAEQKQAPAALKPLGVKLAHALCLWMLAAAGELQAEVEAAAAKEAEAKKRAELMFEKKKCRPCLVKDLKKKMDESHAAGKTPMFINDKDGQWCVSYMTYHANIIDAKKLTVEQYVQKKPIDEIKEDVREKLVANLKYGKLNCIAFTSSAYDFKDIWDPAKCPDCLFKWPEFIKKENYEKLLTEADKADFGIGGIAKPDDYRLVLQSEFEVGDYQEFFKDNSLPLADLDVYALYTDDTGIPTWED